jgi:FkbM family methyltransferase
MLLISTAHKIALARGVYHAVRLARSVGGRGDVAEVSRRGIRWRLDLSEGIDFSIWLLGGFELQTAAAYARFVTAGSVVLDIGANIGAHTLPFARAVGPAGKVVAFEPTSYAYGKLLSNIERNPDLAPRIETRQVLLSASDDADSSPMIYSSWPLDERQGAHPAHKGQLMPTLGARARSLDTEVEDARLSRIDFIKLDVDGHEHTVLAGARWTLQRFSPVIGLELCPYVFSDSPGAFASMLQELDSHGYRLRDFGGREVPLDAQRLEAKIPWGKSTNVIAEPQR